MSEKYTSLSSRESVRKNPKATRDEYEEEYHVSRHKHVSMTIEYDEEEEEEVVRRGSSSNNHIKAGNHGHANSKKTTSHGQHPKHHNNDGYECSQPYGNATADDVADDYGGQATVDDVADDYGGQATVDDVADDDYEIPHSRGGHAKSKKSNHHSRRYDDDGEYGKATVTHVAPDYY